MLRTIAAALAVVSGLGLVIFFGLLLVIADCSQACVARGERAVPVGLMAIGLGLVAAGFRVRSATRPAVATGLTVAGATGMLGVGYLLLGEGSRGFAWWALLVAVGMLVVGLLLLRADAR